MTDISRESIQPEEDELIADQILRDLFERHDVLGKGWHEPVYGKKIHIGEKCQSCGTNFGGLREDIKTLVKYHFATHSKKQELRARIDEANGVQLAYNHMLAQTHASGSWQSMTDRREDLKAQLTAIEGTKDDN